MPERSPLLQAGEGEGDEDSLWRGGETERGGDGGTWKVIECWSVCRDGRRGETTFDRMTKVKYRKPDARRLKPPHSIFFSLPFQRFNGNSRYMLLNCMLSFLSLCVF